MKGQNFRKKTDFGQDSRPVYKRPRVGSSPGTSTRGFRNGSAQFSSEKASNRVGTFVDEEDDPFAGDDFTGEELEELEWVATQAEIKLTQEQQSKNKPNNDILCKKPPPSTNYSFKMPTSSKVNGNPSNFHQKDKNNEKTIRELQDKIDQCNHKIKEMEKNYSRKDGEIGILRDRLATTQKDLDEQKMKAVEFQQRHKNEKSEREKFLEREVEKYKDQIQFKQAEMMESQGLIRNLETKNKMLMENQRLGSLPPSHKTDHSSMDWSCTQDGASGPKKIKLIKPESPRVQSSTIIKKNFEGDSGKKKLSTSSSKPSTSSSESAKVKNESCVNNFRLQSKYMRRDFDSAAVMQQIMFKQESDIKNLSEDFEKLECIVKSPILILVNRSSDTKRYSCVTMIMDCINKIIRLPETDIESEYSIAKPLVDLSCFNGFEEFIRLINDALSPNTSTQENSTATYLQSDSISDFEKVQAAIQILEVLTTHSSRFALYIVTQESHEVTEKLLSMNFLHSKSPRLQPSDHIHLCTLKVLRNLVRASSGQDCIVQFSSFLKKSYLLPLTTHQNASISSVTFDILSIFALHRQFALEILKEDSETESSSILGQLCHVCVRSNTENKKIIVLLKIINLLSILVCEHETLLMEQSCYAEIYHTVDILLYNQLLLWRKDKTDQNRNSLIQRALCLLHSCANVYTDGIPDSRRDHRHQVVLTDLAHFLREGKDKHSFWFQELNRIVKSEVKALFEEKELT